MTAVPADDADLMAEAPAGETGFTVSFEGFDGPFDLLLGMIAKRRMDVTTVALAAVTDEFLTYVKTLTPERALDESSHFVFVAATLLDMKIASLLPGAEVESDEDIAALEARDLLFARLLQYKAFKQIAAHLQDSAQANAGRFPRQPGAHPDAEHLLPPLNWTLDAEGLKAVAEKVFARQALEPDDVGLAHLHSPAVSIAEEITSMSTQLAQAGECRFTDLVAEAQNTMVVVVRFLGLLELFRHRQVELVQDTPLGELTVSWIADQDGDSDLAQAAADEWDNS